MACPFFVPTTKAHDIAWLNPHRLPLGGGWSGHCGAPGHEGTMPEPAEIKENCNLGYAACERLPAERDCDAVRFSVARDTGSHLLLWFVLESRHLPVGYGTIDYAVTEKRWMSVHPRERIQRMADCYIQSYLARKAAVFVSTSNPPENQKMNEENINVPK